MSAEEPETAANDETEPSAANDATEVNDHVFSTRTRNVAGGQAETFGEAWFDEDEAGDAESGSTP
jgi:hypothetical protein